jgi:Ion transport protein
MLFFLFLTGVVGTQLFAQAYHQACVNIVTGEIESAPDHPGQVWGPLFIATHATVETRDMATEMFACPAAQTDAQLLLQWGCGNRQCPDGHACAQIEISPLVYNVAGFDNVGTALLTAFQVSTIASWAFIFYRTWDTSNVASLFYFLIIIVCATYVLVNLFLAVLKLKFASASRSMQANVEDEHKV